MAGLLSLLKGRTSRLSAPLGDLAPLACTGRPVCIIGDLHGRLDLLERMQARIAAQPDAARARLIVVGDMIDRGPSSAGVLRMLFAQTRFDAARTVCLMGNHERMMLDFLANPTRHGPRWLAHGGADTLASFGISPWSRGTEADAAARMTGLAEGLRAALPEDMRAWLETLPLIWHEDRLAVTHAAADPGRAIDEQDAATLLWGHRAFLRQPRSDGIWVAHGHTIVGSARAEQGRIAVDTGAWRSGRLSAAWIDAQGVSFLDVSEPG